MTTLIRFHNWIIDKEQIDYVEIECKEGIATSEFDKKKHALIVHLKTGRNFQLICPDHYDATKELNYLTTNSKAEVIGGRFDTYILQQIYIVRSYLIELSTNVNKLMKSYSKSKNKLSKKTKELSK